MTRAHDSTAHDHRRHDRSHRGAEAFAREWFEVVASKLHLGVRADVTRGRSDLVVSLTPDGKGFGHRRPIQVASALQTLLESALAREGFREGAEVRFGAEAQAGAEAEGLNAAVRDAAMKAVERGRAFAIGPMSVPDRRQIHQGLGEVGSVWTQSEGEGIYRRLWIIPRHPPARPAEGT